MGTTGRQLDTFVLEHALKPQFWILGASIIVFWIATMRLARADKNRNTNENHQTRFRNTSKNTTTTSAAASLPRRSLRTSTPPQPVFTAWVSQFLTTRFRKSLALAVYAGVLGGQLLESYWVTVTLRRWTSKLFSSWPDHGTWAYGVYFLSVGVMLIMDVASLALSCLLALFHLVCIWELVVFRVRGAY